MSGSPAAAWLTPARRRVSEAGSAGGRDPDPSTPGVAELSERGGDVPRAPAAGPVAAVPDPGTSTPRPAEPGHAAACRRAHRHGPPRTGVTCTDSA
ncbi:hypothetical protein GCM10010392_47300 [Streptomyces clavifer]|uniref:Uncharacterized protein n=1 Tax=Streptomyces clavifer TaxID=68188 RepID=A0ABS4VEI9_9ACTN|nr:hypothetical protein [Streptomyces clavifer]GHB13859.1 hypothetical protein GCM10010392_47300 [Streptomyces clavifer]